MSKFEKTDSIPIRKLVRFRMKVKLVKSKDPCNIFKIRVKVSIWELGRGI